MKNGQKVKCGGIIGTIIKVGEKRMVEKAHPNKAPYGDGKPYEIQDVLVEYESTGGKKVKGWWDVSKCKLICNSCI